MIKRLINKLLQTSTTLDEIASHFINASAQDGTTIIGLGWEIYWNDNVSNSHSCPSDGVTNWGGDKKFDDGTPYPTGYPGWTGRVWVRYDNFDHKKWGSDPFDRTLLHTGGGGAGSYNGPWTAIASQYYKTYGHRDNRNSIIKRPDVYSWDFRIYAQDFPEVAKQWEADRVWAMLADKPIPTRHEYQWDDRETYRKDREFLASLLDKKSQVA